MAEYYRVVIPETKKVFKLGTLHNAIHTFPLLLEKVVLTNSFILYGDETHGFLQDRYEYNDDFEVLEFHIISNRDIEWTNEFKYTTEKFREIFNELGGDKITTSQIQK